jgi:hypothetical protein
MSFMEKLTGKLNAAFHRSSDAAAMDIDVQRQNTPPDELDAELAEAMEGQEFVLPRREPLVMKARAKAAGDRS